MLYKLIFKYYKRFKIRIFFGFLFLIIVDIAQLIIPRIIQKTIDSLIIYNDISKLLFYTSMILIIGVSIGIFRFIWRMTIIGMAHFIEYDFKNTLFEHLLKLSANFFNRTKTGDIMAHMTNDMRAVRMASAFGIIAGFDAFFLFSATLIFMLKINPKLTLFAMIPLPLISFIALFFMKSIFKTFKKVQNAFSLMTNKIQEIVSGIKIIQAFQQEDAESKNFDKISNNYVNINISLTKLWGIMFPLIFFLAKVGIAIIILIGGQLVIENKLSPGEFIAFFSYLNIIVWPMMAIGWVTNVFQRGNASYKRIYKFLSEKPDIIDNEDAEYKLINGNIQFKNIKFSYDNNNVLDNINFNIQNGEYIGICGKIGSGKSTIAKLILRIIEPQEGEILFDNINYKKIKIAGVRDSIGYVPQDSFLFSATIKENLLFAKPDATQEEIENVCKIASVHKNIMELKDGYNTIIGEKGVTLSGGQKQRICIARALIKNPKILVLDDALSAVDTNTEKEIIENIAKFSKNITTIVISHRISSFINADKIIVLDNGKIDRIGKHEELLEKSEIYQAIYEIQKLGE